MRTFLSDKDIHREEYNLTLNRCHDNVTHIRHHVISSLSIRTRHDERDACLYTPDTQPSEAISHIVYN